MNVLHCVESTTVCDIELLYADDLILMAETEESLHDKIVKRVGCKRLVDEYRKNKGNVQL